MMHIRLFCHIYNEELMLPGFLEHHLPLVDHGVIIDHHSTDNSVAIIKEMAPGWDIHTSKLSCFDAQANDIEVMNIESMYPTREGIPFPPPCKGYTLVPSWKICLNVTEWLWEPDIRSVIARRLEEFPTMQALGMTSFILVDNEERPLLPSRYPLWKERHHGYLDPGAAHRRWRFIHNQPHGAYATGRHGTYLPRIHDPDLHLLYFSLSPYPQCLQRKLAIQHRIPLSDKLAGLGASHITTEEKLREVWQNAEKGDLLLNPKFESIYNHFLGMY